MYDVKIKSGRKRRMFAVAHVGPYSEIGAAFDRLEAAIAGAGLAKKVKALVGIYHDDPAVTPPYALRSHAGVIVGAKERLPEGLQELFLPAGRTAVLQLHGPYSGLQAAYGHLYGVWLPASGETPGDAPSYEIYVNSPRDTAPQDLLTDIHLPLA